MLAKKMFDDERKEKKEHSTSFPFANSQQARGPQWQYSMNMQQQKQHTHT